MPSFLPTMRRPNRADHVETGETGEIAVDAIETETAIVAAGTVGPRADPATIRVMTSDRRERD